MLRTRIAYVGIANAWMRAFPVTCSAPSECGRGATTKVRPTLLSFVHRNSVSISSTKNVVQSQKAFSPDVECARLSHTFSTLHSLVSTRNFTRPTHPWSSLALTLPAQLLSFTRTLTSTLLVTHTPTKGDIVQVVKASQVSNSSQQQLQRFLGRSRMSEVVLGSHQINALADHDAEDHQTNSWRNRLGTARAKQATGPSSSTLQGPKTGRCIPGLRACLQPKAFDKPPSILGRL
jgi:hypothetical protein